MFKLDKTSPLYFFSFFIIVIFGIVFSVSFVYDNLKDEISEAKMTTIQVYLNQNLKCKNIEKTKIKNDIIFYCPNNLTIAKLITTPKAYADVIEFLLFINLKGKVQHIDIISHKETAGLGAKIEDVAWLKTIYNKPFKALALKSDGGEIDSFTSASITPRALLYSIKQQSQWVLANKDILLEKIKTQGK